MFEEPKDHLCTDYESMDIGLKKEGKAVERQYSEHILPIVEGKCMPESKVVLENGEWKQLWWYPEPGEE